VLAAVLVGPWLGTLVLTVVLVVQGFFFADGGLSALGLNVFNMALVGTLGGYLVYRGLIAVLPKNRPGTLVSAGLAAGLSVPLAAFAFVLQYAIGGEGGVTLTTVAAAMGGVHLLIGIGEGLITAMVVGAVLASRPDLVAAAPKVEVEVMARG
jgi:cobalt/nickel transport system permease protein